MFSLSSSPPPPRHLPSFPTRRSSDLLEDDGYRLVLLGDLVHAKSRERYSELTGIKDFDEYNRSEEHTSELQSRGHLVCRLLLEKKKEHKKRYCEQSWEHRVCRHVGLD